MSAKRREKFNMYGEFKITDAIIKSKLKLQEEHKFSLTLFLEQDT